jgi:hypothetical protein
MLATESLNGDDPELYELMVTLRTLSLLGYIAPDDSNRAVLEAETPKDALARFNVRDVATYRAVVSNALSESHL